MSAHSRFVDQGSRIVTNAFLLGPWLPAFLAVLLFGPTLLEQLARRRKTPANYIDPRRRLR